MRKILARG